MLTVQPTAPTYPYLARFLDLIGPDRAQRLREAADRIRARLDGGTLWHVNSTAAGGGVAEMLHTLIPLYRALGVSAGWLVIDGDGPFFTITKRLGAALYGSGGDAMPLGAAELDTYMSVLANNAEAARSVVRRSDVLLLHDHQTAGLIELLRDDVSAAYWRCHVGTDDPNPSSAMGWQFLKPLLGAVSGTVFSVPWHVPDFLSGRRVAIIPPFLSPYSAKNRDLPSDVVHACLVRTGLRAGTPTPISVRTPAGVVGIRRPVRVLAERPPHNGEPLVVQVSRWDRLKDMHGVLAAFADGVDNGYLALVGPDPAAIPDDVEQADWFNTCEAAWRSLSDPVRQRTSLVCLPMDDLAENAVLVNAIQRGADVIAQKSLAEGFGLTVTEAMWKFRVVVASAVGGIRTQIHDGHTGLLARDPDDLRQFGALLAYALGATIDRPSMGESAHQFVLNHFLPNRDIVATAALMTRDPGTSSSAMDASQSDDAMSL